MMFPTTSSVEVFSNDRQSPGRHRAVTYVLIYDNSDLNVPYRQVAVFDHGQLRHLQEPIPDWLRPVLP